MLYDAVNVLLAGDAWIILNGEEYRLQAGDALFLTQGTLLDRGVLTPGQPLEVVWLFFEALVSAQLRLFSLTPPPNCLTGSTAAHLRGFMLAALDEWQHGECGHGLMVNSLLLQLLVTAYRSPVEDRLSPCRMHPFTPPAPTLTEAQQAQVQQGVRYLTAHYAEPVSLLELAEQVSLHPSAFCRRFRALVGMPPMKYLEQLRMAEAERLLLNTDLHVQEIARRVGYPDPYHFSRVFRRSKGHSPSAYRILVNEVHPRNQN